MPIIVIRLFACFSIQGYIGSRHPCRMYRSDGVSQANELLTLNQVGIASIDLAYKDNATIQNNNVISGIGRYTRTDGTSATLGSASSVANLNLVNSTFYSHFTQPVTLTPQANALPEMQGSGMVRDMREAASLDTDAGRALAAALTHYSTLTTRKDQFAALDDLLLKWSKTSGMPTMIDRALAARFIPEFIFGSTAKSTANAAVFASTYQNTNVGDAYNIMNLYDDMQDSVYMKWINKLSVLERFNGREFITFTQPVITPDAWLKVKDPNASGTGGIVNYYLTQVNIRHGQIDLLDQSYQALRDSVYEALLPQTRLKPYLDAISVTVDASGKVALDFTGMEAAFNAATAANELKGVTDLIDLLEIKSQSLKEAGWKSWGYLDDILGTVTKTPEMSARLNELNIISASYEGVTKITGSSLDDIIIGTAVDDILSGGEGNDYLYGFGGNDQLYGGKGADTLIGFAGDDALEGGNGNDTLYGNDGCDVLNGGSGADLLAGGAG